MNSNVSLDEINLLYVSYLITSWGACNDYSVRQEYMKPCQDCKNRVRVIYEKVLSVLGLIPQIK